MHHESFDLQHAAWVPAMAPEKHTAANRSQRYSHKSKAVGHGMRRCVGSHDVGWRT